MAKPTHASVKRSITLPVELDKFIDEKSKAIARQRGNHRPNFSAALTDLILSARNAGK